MSRKPPINRLKPDADLAAWCAALVPQTADEVPAEWLTLRDIATKLGKADSTIGGQLARAVREGRAEVRRFRVATGRGVYPVHHYRLK